MPEAANGAERAGKILQANGPFDLGRALTFLEGFAPAGFEGGDAVYTAAHVLNGRAVAVHLASLSEQRLRLTLAGPNVNDGDYEAAERLVRRVFSLDWDGTVFYERIGSADPVLAGLQAHFQGLRPVLFGSPFEALCWAIIGQRIAIAQAARLKLRLTVAFGPTVELDEQTLVAFPAPEHLLALDPAADRARLGLPEVKLARLRQLAERGARGELDAETLLGMPPEEARAWLEQSPGIGPWASEFALIRGAGHPDLLPHGERRLLTAVQRYYGLDHEPDLGELERMGERWAVFRSWAAFLLRVALQEDTHEIRQPADRD